MENNSASIVIQDESARTLFESLNNLNNETRTPTLHASKIVPETQTA